MRPITFACRAILPLPAAEIAGRVLDVARWPDFRGWGPVPGIAAAAFEVRTPEVVGSRIRVTNRDGTTHVEVIEEWEPDRRVRLRMAEFSPPLSRLAAGFVETWAFEPSGAGTGVTRTFELHPRSAAAWPPLWVVSRLLRRAVARHLLAMREAP